MSLELGVEDYKEFYSNNSGHTNWCDENDNIDKEPLRHHSNRRPQVSMALRIDLGRITERNGEERYSLEMVSRVQSYEGKVSSF
jgi:hypothetical protein